MDVSDPAPGKGELTRAEQAFRKGERANVFQCFEGFFTDAGDALAHNNGGYTVGIGGPRRVAAGVAFGLK